MKGWQVGIRCVLLSLAASLLAAGTVGAGFGPTISELHNTEGTFTVVEGMCLDDGAVYFGNFTDVLSLDLRTLLLSDVGDLPANTGVSVVQRAAGATYAGRGVSFSAPYPCAFGYIDAGGVFTNTWFENGIFDAAVNGLGEMYVVANPEPSDFSTNPPYLGTGTTALFRYDPLTDTAAPVAVMGGIHGGIAFDGTMRSTTRTRLSAKSGATHGATRPPVA